MNSQVKAAVNGLGLKDVEGALALARVALHGFALKPEARASVLEKVALLEERRRRLLATEDAVRRGNQALLRKAGSVPVRFGQEVK